jgi:hypothetical protein
MLATLTALSLLGQAEEWAPPPATTTPPTPAEPAATPPEAPELPSPEAEKPATEPVQAEEPELPPPPDPRRFTVGHAGIALMGALGSSGYFAVRLEGGAVYGWPRRMPGTLDRASGPSLGVAVDLLAAKMRISECGSAGVCGSRYQAGLALRTAWNWGVIGQDGVVAPVHSLFFQTVAFLSSNSVPSAPLAPGDTWGEHGLRFDLGVTTGILRGSIWPSSKSFVLGGGLYFALSLEWMIVHSDVSGTFRAGASLGVGL